MGKKKSGKRKSGKRASSASKEPPQGPSATSAAAPKVDDTTHESSSTVTDAAGATAGAAAAAAAVPPLAAVAAIPGSSTEDHPPPEPAALTEESSSSSLPTSIPQQEREGKGEESSTPSPPSPQSPQSPPPPPSSPSSPSLEKDPNTTTTTTHLSATPPTTSPLPPEKIDMISSAEVMSPEASAGLVDNDDPYDTGIGKDDDDGGDDDDDDDAFNDEKMMPPLPREIGVVAATANTTTTPTTSPPPSSAVSSAASSSSSSSFFLASLRNTVASVSDRLLDIQYTAEEEGGDADSKSAAGVQQQQPPPPPPPPPPEDEAPVSASAMTVQASNNSNNNSSSSDIMERVGNNNDIYDLEIGMIFTDSPSSTPVAAPAPDDDLSLEELFATATANKGRTGEEEEKQEVTQDDDDDDDLEHGTMRRTMPKSPPRSKNKHIAFEALPPSPQRQPKPQSVEQPWEMPPTTVNSHLPDLTATAPAAIHHHRRKRKGDGTADTSLNDDEDLVESASPAQRMIRLIACCAVALVLFLSIWLIPDYNQDNADNTGDGGPGVLLTPSPTILPTRAPLPSILPTLIPTTTTTTPTTPAPVTVDFMPEASFEGSTIGSRLGTSVAMDKTGTFMAALDGTGTILVYHKTKDDSSIWQLFSTVTIGVEEEPITSMDMVVLVNTTVPLLAMASQSSVHTIVYDSARDYWFPRGQSSIDWLVPIDDNTSPIVSLSSTGNSLATAGLVNGGGNAIIQVWQWSGTVWEPQGEAVVLVAPTTPFRSLSLDLSGPVFAVGDWTIGLPAVTVQAYQWNSVDGEWIRKGSAPTFLWGPSDVALTDDGNCFAVATPTPGTARVYHWNDAIEDWELAGSELMGGSSIAIADTGRRVMVGSSLTSTVVVYDLNINSGDDDDDDQWEATSLLSGTVGDQYGASIAMAGDGQTLAVGSPLDDSGGRNSGNALVYT